MTRATDARTEDEQINTIAILARANSMDALRRTVKDAHFRSVVEAMVRTLSELNALCNVCIAAHQTGAMPSVVEPLTIAALDAAKDAVNVLVHYRPDDAELGEVVDKLVREQRGDALRLLLDACFYQTNVPQRLYKRCLKRAMSAAVYNDCAPVIESIGDLCSAATLETMLYRSAGKCQNGAAFKALWPRARMNVCSRTLFTFMEPGPARDFILCEIETQTRCIVSDCQCVPCAQNDASRPKGSLTPPAHTVVDVPLGTCI